jgi:RHS repeat-associated protein
LKILKKISTVNSNGNLLNDSVSTYTYDSANRLTGFSNPSSVSSYQYNGLGDRLAQTVDGVPTNYTLDLNTGLTQVLADGTYTYLYGNGRISQHPLTPDTGTPEYFISDALGSVRQLVDPAGAVTLAQSYAPYGGALSSVGSGVSVWQYTGEARDVSGLTYLRARYLDSGVGRFVSRDKWEGNSTRPLSINRWNYVEGNPVNLTDPSGNDPNIVSRKDWGARDPNLTICDWSGIYCIPNIFGAGEGVYDPDCNPSGYALYSILNPNESLADIYTTIVIHHAGNANNPTINDIQNEHMDIKGYADIGYHYVIDKAGTVYEGRNIGVRGAHVEMGNSKRIGVLVIGDFEPGDYLELPILGEIQINDELPDVPSASQINALRELTEYLDTRFGIDFVAGHNEFNSTRCPGDNLEPIIHEMNRLYGEGY